MHNFLKIFVVFLTSILLSGCASDISARIKSAATIAVANNFEQKLVKGGDFVITTYQRISNKDLPYVFYIEGDGLAFRGPYTISDNPTPMHPMLLNLASLDKRPNVVYIARPCQYTPGELNPRCSEIYWTDKRMANEVVDSINTVINNINNGANFSLVGFSGGGGIAVMVAARNKHVRDIITISGNLDHASFNKYHNARPMIGSLNPINYATQINNIPQLHLSGGADKRVPSFIAVEYIKASASNCVQQKIIPDAKHLKGWDKVWQDILKIKLKCTGQAT